MDNDSLMHDIAKFIHTQDMSKIKVADKADLLCRLLSEHELDYWLIKFSYPKFTPESKRLYDKEPLMNTLFFYFNKYLSVLAPTDQCYYIEHFMVNDKRIQILVNCYSTKKEDIDLYASLTGRILDSIESIASRDFILVGDQILVTVNTVIKLTDPNYELLEHGLISILDEGDISLEIPQETGQYSAVEESEEPEELAESEIEEIEEAESEIEKIEESEEEAESEKSEIEEIEESEEEAESENSGIEEIEESEEELAESEVEEEAESEESEVEESEEESEEEAEELAESEVEEEAESEESEVEESEEEPEELAKSEVEEIEESEEPEELAKSEVEEAESEVEEDPYTFKEGRFHCNLCVQTTKTERGMKIHRRAKHM